MNDELNFHRQEVKSLKTEKDTIDNILMNRTQEVKKNLTNELFKVDEEMKKHFAHQKAENSRIQQQITALKGEKTALQIQLVGLEKKIKELENKIGQEDQN